MGNQSASKLYFAFAGWTFLAVAIVAATVTILQLHGIRSQAEADASASVNRSVLPALNLDAQSIASRNFGDFFASANALIGQEVVRSARVWNSDGELLAAAGAAQSASADAAAAIAAAGGQSSTRKAASPAGDMLVNYVPVGESGVIEIQQDYAPIAASISTSQGRLALIAAAGAIVAMLLLQTILWAATRAMRREYEKLRYLHVSGQALRSTLDLTSVLERLTRYAARYVGAHLALAAMVEEGTEEIILRASYDDRDGATLQHFRAVDLWYVRRCAVAGEPVYSGDEAFPSEQLLGRDVADNGSVTVINVPIPGRDGARGVLTLVRRASRGGYAKADVEMLEEMAAQGGMALEQVALFNEVRNHAEALELSYDGTLRVLMAALDTKDSITQGHSERVARMTVALAKELGVPPERWLDIERGALLHDIGKIGVPDAVLMKPSSLDDEEWEQMEKHPLHAGLMISKVSFLEGAIPIVLYHHERFDGSGYPFKLKESAIPLEARIFTVVDSYDAMTFDRPYREAMPIEDALAEIERHAGTQFDPQVVEAFVRMIRRSHAPGEEAA